jgi:hypothetical protein
MVAVQAGQARRSKNRPQKGALKKYPQPQNVLFTLRGLV